jgi:hypothetical protein
MIRNAFRNTILITILSLLVVPLGLQAQAQNQVMGQVNFAGKTKAEKTAGVWVDDQYVGYVTELTGDKQVFLLPGKHEITVRQTGYLDLSQQIAIEPSRKTIVRVALAKNPEVQFSTATSQIKLEVTPDRAAVLVDGSFAGTVHEFGGVGRAMLVSPGKHHVKIDLVGYRPFDTDVDLQPNQKVTIKTDLFTGSASQADPAIKKN